MLGMIAEKITAQKGEKMIPRLCARVVRKHIGRMRKMMRQKSAKVKQLKSCRNGRDDPKGNELPLVEPKK